MRSLILLTIAAGLSGCMGSQTGKALNAFDSKSFWETDYSEPLHSPSFWYSGYSDDELKKTESHTGDMGNFYGTTRNGKDSGSSDE